MEEQEDLEVHIRRLLVDHRGASWAIRDMAGEPSLYEKAPLETLDRETTLAIVGLLHADLADRIDAALKEYRVAATAFAGADPDIFDRDGRMEILDRAMAREIVGMRRDGPAPVVDPCDTPPAVHPWAGGTDRGRIKRVLARFAEAVAAGCRAYRGPTRDAHLRDLAEEASRQVCDLMDDAPAPITLVIRKLREADGIQLIDIPPFDVGQAVEVFNGRGWEPGLVEAVRTIFLEGLNPGKVHVFSVLRGDGRSLLAGALLLRRPESYCPGRPLSPQDTARFRAEVDHPVEAEIEAGPGDEDTPLPENYPNRFAMVAPWGTWEKGTLIGIEHTGDEVVCTLKLDSGEVLTTTRPQLKALREEEP